MFGLSLLASLVVITLVWGRLARHKIGAAAMVPTLWIVLGPLGQSITAANNLGAQAQAHADAFGHAVGDIWRSLSGLSLPQTTMGELQGEYLKQATALWNGTLEALSTDGKKEHKPVPDRRFSAKDWAASPA